MGPQSLFNHTVRPEMLLVKPVLITLKVQHSFPEGISLGLSALMTQNVCGYVLDRVPHNTP